MTVVVGVLALAFAVLAVPLVLRRPNVAVFGLTFLLAIHFLFVAAQRFGIPDVEKVLLAAGVALVLSYRLILGRGLHSAAGFALVVFLWLLSALNSLLWSESPAAGLAPIREYLPNILLPGIVLCLIDDRERFLSALAGLAAGCIFLSAITLVQYVFGLGSFDFFGFGNGSLDHIAGETEAFRPAGPIYDPNYYAQMLLPGLALMLGATIATRSRALAVLFGVAAVTITAAILLTSSRGALIAVAALLAAFLLRERRAAITLVMVPPVLVALMLVPSYNERVVSIVSAVSATLTGERVSDASFAGRMAEMEAALILFRQSPIVGVGYGTFETKYQQISARYDLKLRVSDRAAHSLYLETAAEQGLVGLTVLLGIIGFAFRAALRCRRLAAEDGDIRLQVMTDALFAGGVGIFVTAIFLHDAYGLSVWLMLALLFASERVFKRHGHAFPVSREIPIHG